MTESNIMSSSEGTLGPSITSSRVLHFSNLKGDDQESMIQFFLDQKLNVSAEKAAEDEGDSHGSLAVPLERCICSTGISIMQDAQVGERMCLRKEKGINYRPHPHSAFPSPSPCSFSGILMGPMLRTCAYLTQLSLI